jgi:hypothetical protein
MVLAPVELQGERIARALSRYWRRWGCRRADRTLSFSIRRCSIGSPNLLLLAGISKMPWAGPRDVEQNTRSCPDPTPMPTS